MVHRLTAGLQRVGDGTEVDGGGVLRQQPVEQVPGPLPQPLGVLRREHDQARGALGCGHGRGCSAVLLPRRGARSSRRRRTRRCPRSAAYSRRPPSLPRPRPLPLAQLPLHHERRAVRSRCAGSAPARAGSARAGRAASAAAPWSAPAMPAAALQMADVRLHRADRAELPSPLSVANACVSPVDLDRIAELGAGAVRLHVADRRAHPRPPVAAPRAPASPAPAGSAPCSRWSCRRG